MHPNPVFRSDDDEKNLSFARARGFGQLSVSADPVPLFAHIPFRIFDDGTALELHLVRSNPIAANTKTTVPAVIVTTGPDSYVSPDWYRLDDQVPTWNYVAVHLFGTLERRPQEELRASIDALSARFESQLAPKTVWTTGKVTPDALDRMMRTIVPFRLTIANTDGTWKLGQNKPQAARLSAASHVEQSGIGHEVQALADLMNILAKS